jgi:predicted aspartyl protease
MGTLAALTLLAGETIAASDLNRLKFDLLESHLVVVHGAIGPLEGLRLLIDTGANPSMVDRRVAKKLALNVERSDFVVFGQKTRATEAVLPDIRLGAFRAEAVTAGVGDLSFLHGVDAIVGLDVLSRSSFSIDYERRTIAFGPVEAGGPGIPLEVTPEFLTVQLAIRGRPFRLLIDTGGRRLVLFDERVRDRLPPLAVHGELTLYHLAGASALRRVILPDVEAGGWTADRVEGFLSDAAVDGYPPGIDGVLGVRVLASKHADFDFERSRFGFR